MPAFLPTLSSQWQVWQKSLELEFPVRYGCGKWSYSDERTIRQSSADADAEIESLARETDMPVELVQEIYTSERAKLERTARIKTFVAVLVHRQVKARLREQRASS